MFFAFTNKKNYTFGGAIKTLMGAYFQKITEIKLKFTQNRGAFGVVISNVRVILSSNHRSLKAYHTLVCIQRLKFQFE